MSCATKEANKLANKTISGRPLDLDNPFDFFIYSQQETIFNMLLCLGHPYHAIHGMCFNVIAVIYRKYGVAEWGKGEANLAVIIDDLMINKNKLLSDRSKNEIDRDSFLLKLCCALFCYDRAVSRAKKKRIAESTYWLESALEQDFYIPHIAVEKSKVVSEKAKRAVRLKLSNDPKQKALSEIEQHYEANKVQFKRRGYSAKFIREMHTQYPIIESQKTIENLVVELNKLNDAIPR